MRAPRRRLWVILAAWCLLGVGSAPAEQTGASAGPENFFDMSLEQLMDVEVVSGSHKAESILDTPSNMTVITDRQIKEWGARSLQDVLRRVPGYYVVRDRDEWVYAARGNVSDNNQKYLVLIDGHRMNSINNFGPGQIIELPNDLSNVKRIEIIRGPGSVVWGSGALAGVINIITKDAADLGALRHWMSFKYGEDNTTISNAQVGRVYDHGDWILHGSYVNASGKTVMQSAATSTFPILDVASGYASHPYGQYRTDVDRYDDGYMLYFKGRRGKFSLRAMAFQTSVFNRHYESERGRDNFLSTEKYFIETERRDQAGAWDLAWKTFFHYNKAEYENKRNANTRPSYLERVWQDKSVATSLTASRPIGQRLFFNSGLEYTYTRTGPDRGTTTAQSPPYATTRTTAHFEDHDITGFATLDYRLTESLKLIGGCGINYNDDRGSKEWVYSPRAGLIWHASQNTTHKLLYNFAFLRPATFQAANNSAVDSEQMKQIEYILIKKLGPSTLTTTLYWQKLDGFINILSLGGGASQFNNAGDYKSKGIELEFATPFKKDHTLWANAAYCDAEAGGFPATLPFNSRRVDPHGKLLSYPELTFNAGGTFRFMGGKLFVSPAVRYVGSVKYRATPAATAGLADARYEHAGPFAFLDLNIGYEPSENLGLYAGFHNLTDVDSKTHLSIWNGTIGQPGRYFQFNVVYRFK